MYDLRKLDYLSDHCANLVFRVLKYLLGSVHKIVERSLTLLLRGGGDYFKFEIKDVLWLIYEFKNSIL
jgi:hypothetical protein